MDAFWCEASHKGVPGVDCCHLKNAFACLLFLSPLLFRLIWADRPIGGNVFSFVCAHEFSLDAERERRARKQAGFRARRSLIVFWWERLLFWITRQHFNSVSHVSLTQAGKFQILHWFRSLGLIFSGGAEQRILASSKINSFPWNADKMLRLVTNYIWCVHFCIRIQRYSRFPRPQIVSD